MPVRLNTPNHAKGAPLYNIRESIDRFGYARYRGRIIDDPDNLRPLVERIDAEIEQNPNRQGGSRPRKSVIHNEVR